MRHLRLGIRLAPTLGAAVVAGVATLGTMSPAAGWTGTAGSGYSSTPTNPTRTTAQAYARLVGVQNRVFTANHTLVVSADAANGGIAKVRFYCEGNTVDVTTPQWTGYTDSNGVAQLRYGYSIALDWAAISAKAASGTLNCYAEVFPTDATILNRVLGPFAFHNRPVGQDYSFTKTVGATGADFTTLVAAIDWMNANVGTARNGRIQVITSGDYPLGGAASTYSNAPHWLTIETATSITCNITSGATRTTIRPFYDGLRFKGSGMTFDLAKFQLIYQEGTDGVGSFPSNLMQVWFDGVTIKETGGRGAIFDGQPPDQFWVAASQGGTVAQATMEIYFTDCTATNCYWGYHNAKLALNCTATTLADDFMQNVRCWHNMTLSGLDSVGAGLRSHVAAVNITYTGGGTSATIEATNAPGNPRTMSLFKNGAQVGTSLSVTYPAYSAAGSGYTTWADVVAWINAQGGAAGFAATVNGAAGTRRAASVSQAALLAAPMTGANALNVFGGSGTLTSWFDIHGDVLQIFEPSGGTWKNIGGRFLSARGVNSNGGGQGFFIDSQTTSLQDCSWRNFELATDGQAVQAVSQWHSPAAHVMLRYFTLYDQPFLLRTDALFNPDNRCEITGCSFYTLAWQTTPDVDLKIDKVNVRSGSLPSGATNSTTVSTLLYNAAPTDLSPGANMPAGVGSRVAGGAWNVA